MCHFKPYLLFIVLILCSPHLTLASSLPERPDETALRQFVKDYYATYSSRNLDAYIHLWSDRSPFLAAEKQVAQKLFAAAEAIEIKSVTVERVKLDDARASLRVEVERRITGLKDAGALADLRRVTRVLECVTEGGVWKAWRDMSGEESLASEMAALATDAERRGLLANQKELMTVEMCRVLVRYGNNFKAADDYRRMLSFFQLAQVVAEQINDRTGILESLNGIGGAYHLQGQKEQALPYYEKALKLGREWQDKPIVATSLGNIGLVYYDQGRYDVALENYRQSLEISEEVGRNDPASKKQILGTLNNMAVVYRLQGDLVLALAKAQESLSLAEELNDGQTVARALHNLGSTHASLGNYDTAIEFFEKSLAICERENLTAGRAMGLNNLGNIHLSRGDYRQAMACFLKSLELKESLANNTDTSGTLLNIGLTYMYQNDENQALSYFERALQKAEKAGPPQRVAEAYNNMGALYMRQDNYALAEQYYLRTLGLSEQTSFRRLTAEATINLGDVHLARGNHEQAEKYYLDALKSCEAMGDQEKLARALRKIGLMHLLKKTPAESLNYLERSLALANRLGLREMQWRTLTLIGMAYRAEGQPERARQSFGEAIEMIEEMRSQVAGDEQSEQRSFENRVSPYQEMVALLVTGGRWNEALAYAERAKARVLLDVLRGGRVSITKAMTATEREQEQSLKLEMVSLNLLLARSRRQAANQARTSELKERLEAARIRHDSFQMSLYAAHPELKVRRGQATAFDINQATQLLPDAESALLEYVSTADSTFLFVVTREAESNRQAAGAGEKVVAAKPVLKVYDLGINHKVLTSLAQGYREQLARRDLLFLASASRLYNELIKPAEDQLKDKTRLVIVPDASLWELPFQALKNNKGKFLIENFTVSYAPSLAALGEMGKLHKARASLATKATLLAFGNPSLGQAKVVASNPGFKSEALRPLPEAEAEVKTIERLYGTGESKIYLGDAASEERLKAEAGKYRIVHLATHATVDNANPMHSLITLSQAASAGAEDGLLEAWEIMNLELSADLVVLSACETARGRIGAGEGVIGLSWALFVAGAPSALVSQWKVDAASTTQLMQEFYRVMKYGSPNGGPPASKASALRKAALKLLRTNQYRHPFYWAGFVLIGDGF